MKLLQSLQVLHSERLGCISDPRVFSASVDEVLSCHQASQIWHLLQLYIQYLGTTDITHTRSRRVVSTTCQRTCQARMGKIESYELDRSSAKPKASKFAGIAFGVSANLTQRMALMQLQLPSIFSSSYNLLAVCRSSEA